MAGCDRFEATKSEEMSSQVDPPLRPANQSSSSRSHGQKTLVVNLNYAICAIKPDQGGAIYCKAKYFLSNSSPIYLWSPSVSPPEDSPVLIQFAEMARIYNLTDEGVYLDPPLLRSPFRWALESKKVAIWGRKI